jgi:hypothetical protein
MFLPNNIGEYKVLNKKSYLPYKDKLFNLFDSFSKSTDKLKDNYKIENLEFDKSKEISLIIFKEEIVAYASVLDRDIWPSNTSRIFNRLLRNKKFEWKNPVFGIISKLIHDHQISYCKSINKDYLFVSQETKKLWLQKWIEQANEYSPGWIICNEKKKVTNGNSNGSMQYIAYKKISNTNEPFLL